MISAYFFVGSMKSSKAGFTNFEYCIKELHGYRKENNYDMTKRNINDMFHKMMLHLTTYNEFHGILNPELMHLRIPQRNKSYTSTTARVHYKSTTITNIKKLQQSSSFMSYQKLRFFCICNFGNSIAT